MEDEGTGAKLAGADGITLEGPGHWAFGIGPGSQELDTAGEVLSLDVGGGQVTELKGDGSGVGLVGGRRRNEQRGSQVLKFTGWTGESGKTQESGAMGMFGMFPMEAQSGLECGVGGELPGVGDIQEAVERGMEAGSAIGVAGLGTERGNGFEGGFEFEVQTESMGGEASNLPGIVR